MEPASITAAIGVGSAALKTVGALSGDAKEARDAEARERMAKINADESEASALADLKRQIGNIKAIRASAGGSIDTPTMQAIIAEERKVSDVNRAKRRNSFKNEALQAAADKSLIKRKAFFTIASGALQGASSLADAIPEQ